MSIKGFNVNGVTEQYDYNSLDNKPEIHNVPTGGTVGQVLAKTSGADYAVGWVNQTGGGGGGDIIVDSALSTTSENPVQNKVVTTAINAKYAKPAYGIPATDMTSAVQASLSKADTALQTAPVTSVNGQTGDVTVQAATDAQVTNAVNTWLDNNVDPATGYVLDSTLTMSNAAAPADKVGDLKSALSAVVATGTEEVYFANTGTLTGNSLGTGIRWMFGNTVNAGEKIKSVSLTIPSAYTSDNNPLVIEIFEITNGTLNRVKEVSTVYPTSAAGSYVTIDINYTTNNPVYISIYQARTQATYTPGTGSMKYIRDITSLSIEESALSTFGGSINADVILERAATLYVKGDPSANVVHIGNGYKYSEIQDALDDITDDSATNPYTFIIHPKKEAYTRFSTIRKLTDAYPWSNAPIRYISLIGMDRYHCIIEDDTGDYSAPPAEILVNGLIANLTFKATHTNQNPNARQGAYAVHIDAEPVGNAGYKLQFENCSFQSDQTAGVGIGLHNASHLQFLNCEFISTASESYSPYEGYTNLTYLGALNCHSSTNANDTDQELALVNCVAIANENKAYQFSTNTNCYMTLKAYNSTFWCIGTGQANGYKGSYCTIFGANHGNNAAVLNA